MAELNAQIKQTVQFTNSETTTNVRAQARGIAYMYVAEATALAVGDGSDYLRNVEILAGALSAVGAAKIAAGDIGDGTAILTEAAAMVTAAAATYTAIGTAAAGVLNDWPSP